MIRIFDAGSHLKSNKPIEGICYSSCAPIFYPDRFNENKDKLEIDYIPPPKWGKVEYFIKEEGIYLFGGRNKNSQVKILFVKFIGK